MKTRQEMMEFLATKGVTRDAMAKYVHLLDNMLALMPELPTPILVAEVRANRIENEHRLQALSLVLPIVLLEASRCQFDGGDIHVKAALEAFEQVGEITAGVIIKVATAMGKRDDLDGEADGSRHDDKDDGIEELMQVLTGALGFSAGDVRAFTIRRPRRRHGAAPASGGAGEGPSPSAEATGGPPPAGGGHPPGGPHATPGEAFEAGPAATQSPN